MISQVNSSVAQAAYMNNTNNEKTIKPNATVATKADGTTKVQQLKDAIDAGTYKVDLSNLAQKMAESLL